MYADLVKNRICRSGSGFHCFLCKVDIVNKNACFLHTADDAKHQQELEGVASLRNLKVDEKQCVDLINNGIVVINYKEYRCTFCLCDIPVGTNLKHVSEHVSGKKHIAKRKGLVSGSAEDLVYLEIEDEQNDSITEIHDQEQSINHVGEDIFFCDKCQDVFSNCTALQFHGMFHLNQNYRVSDIISFSIKENSKQIYCLVCNCVVRSEDDLKKHLVEDVHTKRMIILRCPSNDTIVNIMYLNFALYPNIVIPSATHNIYNTLNEEFYRYLYYLQNMYQAMAQKNQPNAKVFGCNLPVISQQPELSLIDDNSTLPTYFCFICNTKFGDENLLFLHNNFDYIHKFRMESIIFIFKDHYIKFISFDNNAQLIKCTKCQIEFTELNGVVIHLFDMKHLCDKPVECVQIGANGKMLINNKNQYICAICKIHVPTDAIMIQHLTSDYHKIKTHQYYTTVNNGSYERVIFYCPACKMNFFNDRTLLEHFYLQHQSVPKNSIPMNNVVHQSTTNMYIINNPGVPQYYDVKNKNAYPMPSNNFNYVQNNMINSTMNCQRKTAVQGDKIPKDHALVSKKNLINFSPRYVKLCIERGSENIFTTNAERIKNLKLGISLTFPYASNRCCIPCGCEVPGDAQLLYEHLRTEEHETNLAEMEDNDRYFENYRDQLSDLELSKAYMSEDSDEWVNCYACDIKVENRGESLTSHIRSDDHRSKHRSSKESADRLIQLFGTIFDDLWYYIEKYSCNLCCATFDFEIDYAMHLEDIGHLKEVERRLVRNESLQFDCCVLCSSYWYSKADYHRKHCDRESHLYILKSRDFTVPDMCCEAKLLLTSVQETVDRLVRESEESSRSGKNIENRLLRSVEEVVRPRYPGAKAHLFGSRISHLAFHNSNLDIYLDCENQDDVGDQIAKVQDCFFRPNAETHNNAWKIDEIVLRTRAPIIKLKHRSTNLNCDISFSNNLSVEKSKILGYFVNAYLPCRKMILFLKKWSALCNLSGRKGINNFALSWFVIFYLQSKGILPSVHQLIEQEDKSRLVAGWETGVSSNIAVNDVDLSIVDHLRGFFTYYAEFDYISDVACPYLGKVMQKSEFSEIDKLPDAMSFYKTQVKEERIEFFRLDSPLALQEPIDLSQNITKSVTKLQLRMFRQYCSESAAILAA